MSSIVKSARSMPPLLVAAFALAMTAPASLPGADVPDTSGPRQWVDLQGRPFDAAVVRVRQRKVELKGEDGRTYLVERQRLRLEDQEFLLGIEEADILLAHDRAMTAAVDDYASRLEKLRETFKKQGNLDAYLACTTEQQRAATEKTVPPAAQGPVLPEIAELRRRHDSMRDEAYRAYERQRREALEGYATDLRSLIRHLMAGDQIDEAKLADAELKRSVALRDGIKDGNDAPGLPSTPPVSTPATLIESAAMHLSFDRNEGDRCFDLKRPGNRAKLVGAKWYKDPERGGALRLNGKGDHVEVEFGKVSLAASDGFSFSVWLKYPSQSGGTHDYATVFIMAADQHPWPGPILFADAYPNSREGRLSFRTDATHELLSKRQELGDERWHHIVCVRDGDWIGLYIDGDLDAQRETAAARPSGHEPLVLGANHTDHSAQNFEGAMDEFMIFDHALTATDVRQLFDCQQK